MPDAPHPLQRRLNAERLVRRRRADEHQRYAASQRRGRIDPNPHQIDAVIFALRRIPEGGCILADEVGLGKTIEAGLVIAQLLAEGARRVLLIVPKPLLGQWQNELYTLFGMEARESGADAASFAGDGVFLVGREVAGSVRGSDLVKEAEPFDLCVIDEAHEIFANIYRRYDRGGSYKDDSDFAATAHRVRSFLGRTPVLLLTATPIQNNLTELWGLAQYVEPTGTLLGNLSTFRQVFIAGEDRKLVPGQTEELRHRIATICQRTLRRQAQEFLERPFVGRRTQLFEYRMSPQERSLYDDVTAYLLEPELCAFRGKQRRLLLIGFHRRMASSIPALAASLEKVAERLRAQLAGAADAHVSVRDVALDLEDEELEEAAEAEAAERSDPVPERVDKERVSRELSRVERFIRSANELPGDSKARKLLEVVKLVRERGERGEGNGKVVVFTESLTTQSYLERILVEKGRLAPEEVTLFRGQNTSARALEALKRWQEEVADALPVDSRPSRELAIRLALVHEFKTRSRVFISTEAGAKGLNLQFCDTLVNYDLPWNPQRIEQRIGRCHRYGQTHDVTVVNFLAKDNEAQRLTFEILSQKLDLFGKVLEASDHVLYEPRTLAPEPLASAFDFEKNLRKIYNTARTIQAVEEDLRDLRATMEAKREAYEESMRRTAELIETRFDENVKQVFRRLREDLRASLKQLDRDVAALVTGYLDAAGASYERSEEADRVVLAVKPSSVLPEGLRDGMRVVAGHSRDLEDAEPLHLSHGLVREAVDEARRASDATRTVRFRELPAALEEYRGRRGRLILTKITYSGFECVDHLRLIALVEDVDALLDDEDTEALLKLPMEDAPPLAEPLAVTEEDVEEAVDEVVFLDQTRVTEQEQERFERMIEQIERYVDDQVLVMRRERKGVEAQLEKARKKREAAVGADARNRAEAELERLQARLDELDAEIARLQARDDEEYEKWRRVAHERRYVAPTVERLFDVEVVLG